MDVRSFSSWMSAPHLTCLVFEGFEGLPEVFGPGMSARMTPGRPRDNWPENSLCGAKNWTHFFPSNFSGTPVISRPKFQDIPPKSLVFLGFEGDTEFFGPHPFTWKTPTPPEISDSKVWVCALVSCLTFQRLCDSMQQVRADFWEGGWGQQLFRFQSRAVHPDLFTELPFMYKSWPNPSFTECVLLFTKKPFFHWKVLRPHRPFPRIISS